MISKNDYEVIAYSTDYYNRRNWKQAWDMPLHIHDVHELYYLYEGNVQYNIDGNIYDVSAGSLVFIPKSVAHKTTAISLKHDRFVINFRDNSDLKEIFEKVKAVFKSNCICVPFEKRNGLERIFIEIQKESEINDEYSQGCLKNAVHKLFVYIIRNFSNITNEETKSVPAFVNFIAEYIKSNYHDEITLPEMAKIVGMNEAYLSRKFKEYTGTGINEYINVVRVGEAVKLLLNTDYSIVRISNEVGYNDSSYFAMMFKRLIGITPKKYRKQNEETN